jgi:hypothetical protein
MVPIAAMPYFFARYTFSAPGGVAREILEQRNFFRQTAAAFRKGRRLREAPQIQLADDRQRIDLEPHHVNLRAARDDLQLLALRAHADVTVLKMKDAQKVDEVALQKSLGGQVGQLIFREPQGAQVIELRFNVGREFRQRIRGPIPAHKTIDCLIARERVQERLPHRELVEIVVEQRLNDRLEHLRLSPATCEPARS